MLLWINLLDFVGTISNFDFDLPVKQWRNQNLDINGALGASVWGEVSLLRKLSDFFAWKMKCFDVFYHYFE